MAQAMQIGDVPMVKKRISVSQKRQITIPIEFFNSVGIKSEVECYLHNNSIVIKPISETTGEFDEEILADLISQGFSGNELLLKFKEMRKQIRPAVLKMIDDATLAAQSKGEFFTCEDIFGEDV